MSDPSGQPSNGLHFMSYSQFFLETLAYADIVNGDEHAGGAFGVAKSGGPDGGIELGIIFAPLFSFHASDRLALKCPFNIIVECLILVAFQGKELAAHFLSGPAKDVFRGFIARGHLTIATQGNQSQRRSSNYSVEPGVGRGGGGKSGNGLAMQRLHLSGMEVFLFGAVSFEL